MKIYDCFTFYNELDLLELRLKILDPFVDYFVLVEATKTYAGEKKNLYFRDNKNKFKRWEKKIIHVIVEDMPNPGKIYLKKSWKISSVLGLGRWKLEMYQRNQIQKGLKKCRDEDIIILSDLDEIPNPNKLDLLKELVKDDRVVLFSQNLYYYFLNGFVYSNWEGSRACSFKLFRKLFKKKGERFRRLRNLGLRIKIKFLKSKNNPLRKIRDGGWHFSYLGDAEIISDKIKSISHLENDKDEFTNLKNINESVKGGRDIFGRAMKVNYLPIDSTFPEEIVKNKRKYSKFIKKL